MSLPLNALKTLVNKLGTQKAAAFHLGVTDQYIGQILHNKTPSPISEEMAKKLGFRLESKWIKIK